MHMSTLLVALLTAIVVWIFLVRKLTSKPWVAVNNVDELDDIGTVSGPAIKVGFWVFLACISSLFALFATAYMMRMDPNHASDWISITPPRILWLNSALLVLSSIAMQWAKWSEQQENIKQLKLSLAAGGGFTLIFLAGQLLGWQQLNHSSHFDMVNPAVAFFYLLTAVHGLHLLGGLYVWGRTMARLWNRDRTEKGSLSVELCTTYWHYLLLVWFILFALLLSS